MEQNDTFSKQKWSKMTLLAGYFLIKITGEYWDTILSELNNVYTSNESIISVCPIRSKSSGILI